MRKCKLTVLLMFQDKIIKFNHGLAKMNAAFDSIADYKKEVSDLVPEKKTCITQVQEHIENVEKQRQDYILVRDILFSGARLYTGA